MIGNEKPPVDIVESDSQETEPQDTQQAEAPDNVAVDSVPLTQNTVVMKLTSLLMKMTIRQNSLYFE